jgi:P-type E1-E2 ATPase
VRLEAIVFLLAVFPVLGLDAVLHRRARASTERLAQSLAGSATVVRAGGTREIPSAEVVVGDFVDVRGGLFVPADGVFVEMDGVQVDEASTS